MPEPAIEDVKHETIESPYRISWVRVGKFVIPILLLVLVAAFWFVYIFIPSKIGPAEAPIKIPDTNTATPSARSDNPSPK